MLNSLLSLKKGDVSETCRSLLRDLCRTIFSKQSCFGSRIDALGWVLANTAGKPFTFFECCSELGIDPEEFTIDLVAKMLELNVDPIASCEQILEEQCCKIMGTLACKDQVRLLALQWAQEPFVRYPRPLSFQACCMVLGLDADEVRFELFAALEHARVVDSLEALQKKLITPQIDLFGSVAA